MKELFIIIIVGALCSVVLLCQFFMDYKKERLFIASVELMTLIYWLAVVCVLLVVAHYRY